MLQKKEEKKEEMNWQKIRESVWKVTDRVDAAIASIRQKVKDYQDEAPQRRKEKLARLKDELAIMKAEKQLYKTKTDIRKMKHKSEPSYDNFGLDLGFAQPSKAKKNKPTQWW